MEIRKHDVPSLLQTSSSVSNDEGSRQPVHGKRVSLSIRVRGIDCMLADIEAQIRRLRQERVHLSLVREGLTSLEAEQRGSSPYNTGLEEGSVRMRVEAAGSTSLNH